MHSPTLNFQSCLVGVSQARLNCMGSSPCQRELKGTWGLDGGSGRGLSGKQRDGQGAREVWGQLALSLCRSCMQLSSLMMRDQCIEGVRLVLQGYLLTESTHEHSLEASSFHTDSTARTLNSTEYSTTLWGPWQRDSRHLAPSFPWTGWLKTLRSMVVKEEEGLLLL